MHYLEKLCQNVKKKGKFQTCPNQQRETAEDFPGIVEIMEEVCYHGNLIGARVGTVDSAITRIRSEWSKCRDLVLFFASRGLSLGAEGRLYSAYGSVMLYESQTWLVKEENMIRPERGDARMISWMCNIRPENRISK